MLRALWKAVVVGVLLTAAEASPAAGQPPVEDAAGLDAPPRPPPPAPPAAYHSPRAPRYYPTHESSDHGGSLPAPSRAPRGVGEALWDLVRTVLYVLTLPGGND